MSKMNQEYPTPYTACDDPELDYIRIDEKGNFIVEEISRYSELPYDCKTLVDDLVNSSQLEVFNQWDRNFRRKYYGRAIFMAYKMGKASNEGILTKIKHYCKQKIDSFAYWFVCKFF